MEKQTEIDQPVEMVIDCELCEKRINAIVPCEHPKNAYCGVYQFDAAVYKLKMLAKKRQNK